MNMSGHKDRVRDCDCLKCRATVVTFAFNEGHFGGNSFFFSLILSLHEFFF